MAEIIFNSEYELCTINVSSFLEESLGRPLKLPENLRESLDEKWATETSKDLCQYFESLTGKVYEEVARDNVYNNENDLESFFVYSVFAPVGSHDWIWEQDCFVTIEIGGSGDPRCVAYDSALVYQVSDTLGDSGFFSWNIGWLALPISKKDSDKDFERVNEILSQGYSSCPTNEIRDLTLSEPLWSEKRQGYVARLLNHPRPVLLTPYHFCA